MFRCSAGFGGILHRFQLSLIIQLRSAKQKGKMNSDVTTLEDFIGKTKSLLMLEKEEEDERFKILLETHSVKELCDAGLALAKMHLASKKTGFGGRKLVTFAKKLDPIPPSLPNHKLSPGDTVDVSYSLSQGKAFASVLTFGVVYSVWETSVSIACDSWQEDDIDSDSKTFCLVQAVNDVTHKRMMKSLENLENYQSFHGRSLVEYAFGKRILPYCGDDLEAEFSFFDNSLNEVQKGAVKMSCDSCRPISIIHGPPGTGKTRTVVEIIRQCASKNQKVLMCAPSNAAVDNVVERLKDHLRLVRLGHPARSHPNVEQYTLDAILSVCDQAAIIKDIRNEMDAVRRSKAPKDSFFQHSREKRKDLKDLRQELKQRESDAMKGILKSADVICATLTSADPGKLKVLADRGFDVVVIDECAQGLEVACWLALVQGKRCVLAGDHCQLPPTILSEKASKGGLAKTLMGRLKNEFPKNLDEMFKLLTVQYRMNERIMHWASTQMYSNQLVAAESVASHTLSDLCSGDSEEVKSVLWLIDTDDCEMVELVTEDEESKGNPGEVKLMYIHVSRLIEAGIKEEDIAVISPYNLQVQLLRSHLREFYPKLAVRSVDGFQGQEKEAVVLSLVRSNRKKEVGFLNDNRRINVAVTRAKRHLALICDTRTVTSDPFLASLVSYIGKEGTTITAFEYRDALENIPLEIDISDLKEVEATKPISPTDKSTKKGHKAKATTLPQDTPKATRSVNKQTSSIGGGCSKVTEQLSTDSEVNAADWQLDLENRVDSLTLSDDTRLEFPPTLSARERLFVHTLAEKRNLNHFSVGEGALRRIVVEKLTESKIPDNKIPPFSPSADQNKDPKYSDGGSEKTAVKAQKATGAIPKIATSKKPKISKKKPARIVEKDEDDETLLARFATEESKCRFTGCKKPISLLGLKCKFCVKTFCLTHAMPEVHGCGDLVREDARKQVRQEMSGVARPVNKVSDAARKTQLQKKMEERRKNMEEKRKPKTGAAAKK